MYGPPGNGKTISIKAIMKVRSATFSLINGGLMVFVFSGMFRQRIHGEYLTTPSMLYIYFKQKTANVRQELPV
jgi:AAA+ superfamily predicted ATPase